MVAGEDSRVDHPVESIRPHSVCAAVRTRVSAGESKEAIHRHRVHVGATHRVAAGWSGRVCDATIGAMRCDRMAAMRMAADGRLLGHSHQWHHYFPLALLHISALRFLHRPLVDYFCVPSLQSYFSTPPSHVSIDSTRTTLLRPSRDRCERGWRNPCDADQGCDAPLTLRRRGRDRRRRGRDDSAQPLRTCHSG